MDPRIEEWRSHFFPHIKDWSAYDSPAFAARPPAFESIAEILRAAPRLGKWINETPELLDCLEGREFSDLDLPTGFGPNSEFESLARKGLTRLYWTREFRAAEMKEILAEIPAQGHGEAVEVARNFANEKAFQVAVHTLRGNLSPAEAGEAFSNIAEASIAAVLSVIEEEFASWRAPHGETGIAVALLGDSATGQAALGAALDALCVYEGSARYYEELTHRFFEALREYSRENLLFTPIPESGRERPALLLSALAERFRTPGNAEGLLDLARARLVYASGDGAVRTKFEEALLDALSGGTAREALIASLAGTAWGEREPGLHAIAEMRGGLRDIERAARLLQLILAGQSTDTPAIGEAGLFEAAAGHGLISAEAAAGLVEAATLWRNLAGALQLVSEGDFDAGSAAPEARAVIARSCGLQDFDGLDATIRDTASRASAGVEAVKRLCSGRSAPSSSPETPDC